MNAPAMLSRQDAAAILMDMSADELKRFAERVATNAAAMFVMSVEDTVSSALRQAFAEVAAGEVAK